MKKFESRETRDGDIYSFAIPGVEYRNGMARITFGNGIIQQYWVYNGRHRVIKLILRNVEY